MRPRLNSLSLSVMHAWNHNAVQAPAIIRSVAGIFDSTIINCELQVTKSRLLCGVSTSVKY